eukprot:2910914-Rhodomonas_salina.2
MGGRQAGWSRREEAFACTWEGLGWSDVAKRPGRGLRRRRRERTRARVDTNKDTQALREKGEREREREKERERETRERRERERESLRPHEAASELEPLCQRQRPSLPGPLLLLLLVRRPLRRLGSCVGGRGSSRQRGRGLGELGRVWSGSKRTVEEMGSEGGSGRR